MQSDNEIWSVNRIQHEKRFSRKIITICGVESFPYPFLKNQIEHITII